MKLQYKEYKEIYTLHANLLNNEVLIPLSYDLVIYKKFINNYTIYYNLCTELNGDLTPFVYYTIKFRGGKCKNIPPYIKKEIERGMSTANKKIKGLLDNPFSIEEINI